MRTRIALATAMAAASTTIIISTSIAAADLAGPGPHETPGTHTAAAGTRAPHKHEASGQKTAPSAVISADLVDFTKGTATARTVSLGAQGSPVRSLAAELSMANVLHRVAADPSAVTPPTTPPPPPPPPPPVTDATSTATADWQCIRIHESGDVYNDPGRPSGAYGILASTWHSYGFSGWPYQAPAAAQDSLALTLYHQYGWAPWSTRHVCGLG